MSRLGRSQPVQPFATHGFLGNTPANGVLPGRILVVEPEDRRSQYRRRPPLDPVVLHGFLGNVPANGVLPLSSYAPKFVPLDKLVVDAVSVGVARGFVDTTPPPPPVVLEIKPEDRLRQIGRRPALDPIVGKHGFLGNTPANGVLPPPPTVVPLIDERRRQRPTLDPTLVGAARFVAPPATVAPQPPTVVENDRPKIRYGPLAAVVLNGVTAGLTPPPKPPPPIVVALDQLVTGSIDVGVARGFVDTTLPPSLSPPVVVVTPVARPRAAPETVVLTGVLATQTIPVTAPPPPVFSIRDHPRRPTPDPVIFSPLLAAITPPPTPPPAVPGTVQDMTPFIANW